jgi:esterase/lipase
MFSIIVALTLGYFLGPKPEEPTLASPTFVFNESLIDLEKKINEREAKVMGIKPDNQARIVWADSTKKQKTKFVILYVHGFSASQGEGDPIHKFIAKKYKANLFLARLAGHGVALGDSTLEHVTTDQFVNSAEEAYAIAQKLGENVVLMGTSFGGALSIYLASKHPETKGMILYSPCIKLFDPNGEMLDDRWGLAIAKAITGSDIVDFKSKSALHAQYWTTHYHMNGVVQLQNFLTNAMTKETFNKVKCPTFLGYWYKSTAEQDNVVSVPAMLEMYDQLNVPFVKKRTEPFPNVGNHVMASPILSKDVKHVQASTDMFCSQVLQLGE